MRFRGVVLISVFMVCCEIENAQTASAPSATANHSTVNQSSFLTTPFDPTQSTLGPNFRGHDIAAVYRAIDQSPARQERGEFEVNAAFERRQSSFEKVPLYGRVFTSSTFAFVVPTGNNFIDDSSFIYDPDSEKFDVFVPATREKGLRRVTLRSVEYDRGSYLAGNAFNAKARVTSYRIDEFGVHFDINENAYLDPPTLESEHPLVSLPVPLAEAIKLKPALRVLLVCNLIDPWIDFDVSSHDPTITEPEEWTASYRNVNVKLLGIWVFDQRTGKVLEKVSAGSKPFPEECLHRDGSEGMQACLNRVAKKERTPPKP